MKYIMDTLSTKAPQIPRHGQSNKGSDVAVRAAYFFHSTGKEIQKSLAGMLRSLLWQILSQNGAFFNLLLPQLESTNIDEVGLVQSTEVNFHMLVAILRSKIYQPVHIIIDGLDECEDQFVVEIIQKISASISTRNRLYVSGRPLPSFIVTLGVCPTLKMQDHTRDAIERHIEYTLSLTFRGIAVLGKFIDDIVVRSDGSFLWACIVCRSLIGALQDGKSEENLRRWLNRVPTTFENLYREILDSIERPHRQESMQMIAIVCYTARPLTREELCYVLAASFKRTISDDFSLDRLLASRCKGFLVAHAGQVRFCHSTAKDFIQSDRTFPGKEIVQASWNVLLESSLRCIRDFYSLRRETAADSTAKVASPSVDGSMGLHPTVPESKHPPFLTYSITYWIFHCIRNWEAITEIQHSLFHNFDAGVLSLWRTLFTTCRENAADPLQRQIEGLFFSHCSGNRWLSALSLVNELKTLLQGPTDDIL